MLAPLSTIFFRVFSQINADASLRMVVGVEVHKIVMNSPSVRLLFNTVVQSWAVKVRCAHLRAEVFRQWSSGVVF